MNTSETFTKIAAALLTVQGSGIVAVARRSNQALNAKYATMADVLEQALPELQAAGLCFVQGIGMIEQSGPIHVCRVTTRLIHAESGEWIEDDGAFPLGPPPVSRSGAQILNYSQSHGLALTYAKRYALLGLLGIPTGDDKDAQRLTDAMEAPSREVHYTTPPHWTDYTAGRWKREAGSSGVLLGDMAADTMARERKTHMQVSPALQASVADAIVAMLEGMATTYEEIEKPQGHWPAWSELAADQLRGLFNFVLSKKNREANAADQATASTERR